MCVCLCIRRGSKNVIFYFHLFDEDGYIISIILGRRIRFFRQDKGVLGLLGACNIKFIVIIPQSSNDRIR